jgi:predicted nucleic-acid-binding Zn-ribbon protein
MDTVASCSSCRGGNLFRSKEISAGGGYAPNYLPGLGGFFGAEKFVLVVCQDCGLEYSGNVAPCCVPGVVWEEK